MLNDCEAGAPLRMTLSIGKAVTDWTSASKADTKAFGRFFQAMLDNGVYLPPSQFEAAFLSTAHTEQDIQKTIAVAKQAFAVAHA